MANQKNKELVGNSDYKHSTKSSSTVDDRVDITTTSDEQEEIKQLRSMTNKILK